MTVIQFVKVVVESFKLEVAQNVRGKVLCSRNSLKRDIKADSVT